MALFEDTDLAAHLQVDSLDTAVAERAIARAENYLRAELGVEFESAERTLTERVPATATFQQLAKPLTSITTVSVNSVELGVDLWEATSAGVRCAGGFGAGLATEWVSLSVSYVAGFTTPPGELVDWGIYLAALAIRMGPLPGVSQETVGGVFVTHEPGLVRSGGLALPDDVLRTLRARYGSGRPRAGTVRLRP